MISFTDLRSNLLKSQDYSRPNRFIMEFNLPTPLQSLVGSVDYSRLSINCSNAALPGRVFEVSETQYSGSYRHKKASSTTFSDLECSFYLSEDLYEKRIFDAWQTFIFDSEYQVSQYPDNYYADISIIKQTKGLDQVNESVYTFVNAFPINVQDIVQSYDSTSVVDVLPVTFSYHRWFYSNERLR